MNEDGMVDNLSRLAADIKSGRYDGYVILAYDSRSGSYCRIWKGNVRLFTVIGMLEAAKSELMNDLETNERDGACIPTA